MAKKQKTKNIDEKIIDNIKALGIDMINEARSGHPGIVLGAAPIIYTLYAKHMNVTTTDSSWVNRDRFVLSAGHGSALLYSTLCMAGFLEISDLKQFRQLNSKTPGHPEAFLTPGVDMTTGPLGQGFASAVGMAMSEKILNNKYRVEKKGMFGKAIEIFDYNVYVLCSDGDLMEGVSYESASIAGNLNLGNLIVLYDSNDISLDGETSNTFKENVINRFNALNWHTQTVKDGTNVRAISKAIEYAKTVTDKPSIIEIKTIIGKESSLENTNKVHGSPLPKEDIEALKKKWEIRNIPFSASKEAAEEFRKMISERSSKKYDEWVENSKKFKDEMPEDVLRNLELLRSGEIDFDLEQSVWEFKENLKEATRVTSGKVLNLISDNVDNFIGGSADLASSCKTYLNDKKDFSEKNYLGKNIHYGVREHAMGAIMNGIALSGIRTFGSTFLTFSDYLKPSIRLASLMKLPVIYVFTHDSINIGQDGPTHQPIEQLASLRAIPNLMVYRPADANEVLGCYNDILKNKKNPSAIILSRTDVDNGDTTSSKEVKNGAYIVKKEEKELHGIIIATGSEVKTAYYAARELEKRSLHVRVVSMPCMEKFEEMPKDYKEKILPKGYKKVVLEAGSSFGWHKYVYSENYLITLDRFGVSAKKDDVLKELEFDLETITNKIWKLLR